nr:YciI family protein [uncultured Caldimonas sp.]
MFVAILTYVRPLEEVDALLAEHVQFLDRHYASGLFVVSGRRVPRTGGVILIASDDREDVLSVISTDPFAVGGVATYELIEFVPTKMCEGFEPFAQTSAPKAR